MLYQVAQTGQTDQKLQDAKKPVSQKLTERAAPFFYSGITCASEDNSFGQCFGERNVSEYARLTSFRMETVLQRNHHTPQQGGLFPQTPAFLAVMSHSDPLLPFLTFFSNYHLHLIHFPSLTCSTSVLEPSHLLMLPPRAACKCIC